MAGTILQINFKFDGSKAEFLEAFSEVAAPIAATGLSKRRQKHHLMAGDIIARPD